MIEQTSQQKANAKQNEVRKGKPTFSAVRFKDKKSLDAINSIIELHGGTKEAALIAAFKALNKELDKD